MENVNEVKEQTRIQDMYFAAKPPEELAIDCLQRARSFFNMMSRNDYLTKIERSWRFYHGIFGSNNSTDHIVTFVGEEGELVNVPVNHYRNICQHLYNMVTTSRPALQCRAVNSDFRSQAQTILGNGILDYYMREKGMEDAVNLATEYALALSAGYIKLSWNATAGRQFEIDPDTEEPVYEGELEFSVHSPYDIVVDGTKEKFSKEWVIVLIGGNKFNLAAKYKDKADKILRIQTKNNYNLKRLSYWSNDDTADVPVYELFHERCDALPEGRYVLFLEDSTVLIDIPLPYREVPIYPIFPGTILGTPYGYTPMFDIYPIQEMINATTSIIATNQTAFGVQNVFIKNDSNITFESIEGGLNGIFGDEPPIPIQLTSTPKEVFDFLSFLIQQAETISGVNSVARGNPEASLRSGNALALIQSMALQYISGLQKSYIKCIEDVGTGVINILKDYANAPKVVALVGKSNRTYLKEFTGDELQSINRVIVDVGNPLSRTTAGRVQMAEQMMQMGVIKVPQQYFQVINTGTLDDLYSGDYDQLMLIKQENEYLAEGTQVPAILTDDHRMHIMEHRAVLNSPEARSNPEILNVTLAHIQQHIAQLQNGNVDLLQILGQQPLQNPEEVAPPMGGPLNPIEGQAPAAMPPGMSSNSRSMVGPNQEQNRLPNLPKVPGKLLPNPELQDQSMRNIK